MVVKFVKHMHRSSRGVQMMPSHIILQLIQLLLYPSLYKTSVAVDKPTLYADA